MRYYNFYGQIIKYLKRGALALCVAALAFSVVLADEPRIMRLAHIYQPDSPSGIGLQMFADRVHEYSEGRIDVRVFPAGQLGSARNIYISSKSGAIDFCVPSFPILADTVPEIAIMTSGYLFKDFEHIEKVLDNPQLGQKWNREIVEKSRLRIIGTYYYGKRVVTTRDKAFRNPLQAKGQKIRAVPNPMSLAVIKGLGANPTPMAIKEIFIGLSQGVIDGQENPYPTIWSNKFYEVQKYLIETFHQINAVPFAISEISWKRLSSEDQAIVNRATSEAMKLITANTHQFEAEIVDRLKAKGMIIVPNRELATHEFEESVRLSIRNRFDGRVWRAGLMEEVLAAGSQ